MKSYCIRPDYVPREKAETFVETATGYWNEERVSIAGLYQYYVYTRAAALLRARGGGSYLDIGCGYPKKTSALITGLTSDITLMDQPPMKPVIEKDFPLMKFVPVNLENMDQVSGEKYACIVCADVIEHLVDPDSLANFIHEALSENGIAVISTPERDIERGRDCLHSPNPQHVREWNMVEFARYLQNMGFEILEHVLTPAKKLSKAEELLLPLLKPLRTSRYCGCQMVVCRPRR